MRTFIGGVIGAAYKLLKSFYTTQLDRIQQLINDSTRPEAYA